MNGVKIEQIVQAHQMLKEVVVHTPLQKDKRLSDKYRCHLYLKREDLQVVRSFKIRGAYYYMRRLSPELAAAGVVCASAGNHAQGVAYSCSALQIKGYIYMPATTPKQKISQVKLYGGDYVEVVLKGDTFDDSLAEATRFCAEQGLSFIHPFDDPYVIAGQGTVGAELLSDIPAGLDYLFVSIGGGGLVTGVGSYIRALSPSTRIIGVEPEGAPSMKRSMERGELVTLEQIDKFVDGAAVKRVGELTYAASRDVLDDIAVVPEGRVCTKMLELYNENAIVVEPAGALPIAALDLYREQIAGKHVACIISGGNNDIDRMQEIKERSLIYEGLKHYFIVSFPQRAGALREFLDEVLGPNDDITRFEYTKKTSKENGPALVGIELKSPDDYEPLIRKLRAKAFHYTEINKNPELFHLLI